jgi:hypothetical protein
MGVLHADMTAETKDKVKHDELTRVLKMMAKEIRELKIRVKVLEERK